MRTTLATAAFIAAANALVARDTPGCCFGLTTAGKTTNSIGQISDGQVRVGGGLPPSQFCIDSTGGIKDGNGRGCYLTPPTSQLQCDVGVVPMPGFSIDSSGKVHHNASTSFVECQSGQGDQLNIYTSPAPSDVTGCQTIELQADKCQAPPAPPAPPVPSGPPSPVPPVVHPSGPVPEHPAPAESQPAPVHPTPPHSSTSAPGPIGPSPEIPAPPPGPVSSCLTTCGPTAPGPPTTSGPPKTPSAPHIGGGAGGGPPPFTNSSAPPPTGKAPGPTAPMGTGGISPTGGLAPGAGGGHGGGSQAEGAGCGTALINGSYQFPHLIIPINSSAPSKAPGTSLNGTITSSISSIFNFDFAHNHTNRQCSLVFLFPTKDKLETSSFSFSGDGAIGFLQLETPADSKTSFSNAPHVKVDYGTTRVSPGHTYNIASFACPAGETLAFEMKNNGTTDLNYFQDFNPAPIGLYITTC